MALKKASLFCADVSNQQVGGKIVNNSEKLNEFGNVTKVNTLSFCSLLNTSQEMYCILASKAIKKENKEGGGGKKEIEKRKESKIKKRE